MEKVIVIQKEMRLVENVIQLLKKQLKYKNINVIKVIQLIQYVEDVRKVNYNVILINMKLVLHVIHPLNTHVIQLIQRIQFVDNVQIMISTVKQIQNQLVRIVIFKNKKYSYLIPVILNQKKHRKKMNNKKKNK